MLGKIDHLSTKSLELAIEWHRAVLNRIQATRTLYRQIDESGFKWIFAFNQVNQELALSIGGITSTKKGVPRPSRRGGGTRG